MKELQIVEHESGEVVHRSDVSDRTEPQIDKIESGYLSKTDLDRFSVQVVEVDE